MNPATAIVHRAFADFRRYWVGEGSLAEAYWGYGFGGGWILVIILFSIGLLFFPGIVTHYNETLALPTFRGYLAFSRVTFAAYQWVVCILIWRNAKNASISLWKYVARLYVCVYVVLFAFRLYKSI